VTQTQQSTADWQALDSAHFLHPFTNHKQMHAKGARIIEKADGVYLWDSDGNKILDAMAGLWCVNVGYGVRNWSTRPGNKWRPYLTTTLFFKQPRHQ